MNFLGRWSQGDVCSCLMILQVSVMGWFVCLFLYTTNSLSLSLSLSAYMSTFSRCKGTSVESYFVATLPWGSGVNWSAGMVVHDHGCCCGAYGTRRLTETTTTTITINNNQHDGGRYDFSDVRLGSDRSLRC